MPRPLSLMDAIVMVKYVLSVMSSSGIEKCHEWVSVGWMVVSSVIASSFMTDTCPLRDGMHVLVYISHAQNGGIMTYVTLVTLASNLAITETTYVFRHRDILS